MSNWSNEEIINAFLSHDMGIIRDWYDQEKPNFIALGMNLGCKNKDDLIDIYQDTMTALYIKIREGKLPNLSAGLHSYLLAMGKFKVIDHLRAKSKLAVQDLPEEIEKIAFEPIEEVNQDRLKQTQNALLTLGAKCQEIIKLFYYEGKSIKDIATTLNYKDENTVKSHKSRCLKTLKQKLDRL